jgi:hypothetical protein
LKKCASCSCPLEWKHNPAANFSICHDCFTEHLDLGYVIWVRRVISNKKIYIKGQGFSEFTVPKYSLWETLPEGWRGDEV